MLLRGLFKQKWRPSIEIDVACLSRAPHIYLYETKSLKPCSHLTSAFAFTSSVTNGVYGYKLWCSHFDVCIFKNGTDTARIESICTVLEPIRND